MKTKFTSLLLLISVFATTLCAALVFGDNQLATEETITSTTNMKKLRTTRTTSSTAKTTKKSTTKSTTPQTSTIKRTSLSSSTRPSASADSFSWLQKGFVTPAKDQCLCNSGYAFAAIGSLEGHWFRKTSQLVSMSEQQLVDCVYPATGCQDGDLKDAFNYILNSKGIQSDASYPYVSYNRHEASSCRYDPLKAIANITGVVQLPIGDQQALIGALKAYGPIATTMDASLNTFRR